MLLHQRFKRQASPKAIHHPAKLTKELAQAVALKPAEIKQLKTLADQIQAQHGITIQSPLTLLLCPSLLAKAMKEQRHGAEHKA